MEYSPLLTTTSLILRRPFRHRPDSIMAGSIVLAAGLLTFICVQSGIVSSEVVPDGLVYTEVKKTLVKGVPAVLTCHFYRDPQAIYWKKGLNPDDASLLLLWHEGEVSGPRYNDGSCDIDENYSLIIKNVFLVDAGRYYCLVSNYLGILINNYTDVSVVDNAIETESQVTLQMRPYQRGVLKCSVHIRPRMVSWTKKSTSSSSDETLVIFENNGTVVKRSGFGYDEGLYNITENYSLVINDVTVHSEGIYTCNVTDFDTGTAFQDDTLVIVVAQPREPFPTILECLHNDSDFSYCSLDAETALTITCQVSGYYPDITLIFLYGSRKVEILETTERNNIDGTKDKTIAIAVLGSKELYTCVASNIPGSPLKRSTAALLHDTEHFNRAVLMVILILTAALALISLVTYVMWKKRHSNYIQAPHVEQSELGDVGERSLTQEEFQELEKHIRDVSMEHYRKIYDLIERKSSPQVDEIIDENRKALFDNHKMLTDWKANREAGHNRRKIQNAMDAGNTTDNVWPSDVELKWISHHLTHESIEDVCKKLNVTCKSEDAKEEGKRFDSLRKWRNNMAKESLEKKHGQLLSGLEIRNLRGLLPPVRGRFVYKAELVDMAFQLLIHDLLPVIEALGINATKLVSYRPPFDPSHLGTGTIKLLSTLLESITPDKIEIFEKGDKRSFFCNRIRKCQYWRVATNGMLIYDMSYGELGSISAEMKKISEERSKSQEKAESPSGEKNYSSCEPSTARVDKEEDETDNGHAAESGLLQNGQKSEQEEMVTEHQTPLFEVPEDLVDLQNVLQLTDQDVADGLQSSRPINITEYALCKIWKEKPRSSVFNYRAALAHHLRRVEMSNLADEILAGKYIKEHTSLEFIQNMVEGLNQAQLRSLGKLLKLSGKDEQWHTTTSFDAICLQIFEWLANWTKEMKGSWYIIKVLSKVGNDIAEVTSLRSTTIKHKDLNDNLVAKGFIDLAREIMIIEQQLGYVEHNFMNKIANMRPKDVISLVRK